MVRSLLSSSGTPVPVLVSQLRLSSLRILGREGARVDSNLDRNRRRLLRFSRISLVSQLRVAKPLFEYFYRIGNGSGKRVACMCAW